ncbi:PLGRKT (predicted) [Pycnogonum litorale]
MGILLGKTMNENLKKNQDFMIGMQSIQMERQIQMQNQMRERQMSMQIARTREMFYWLGSFYVITSVGLLAGYRKIRKPIILGPLLPLTFFVGYFGDMAYGNKLHRIKSEAENIMEFESQLLAPPRGLPTFAIIEEGRKQMIDDQRVMKSHEFFL